MVERVERVVERVEGERRGLESGGEMEKSRGDRVKGEWREALH